jgi:hypothetical protein
MKTTTKRGRKPSPRLTQRKKLLRQAKRLPGVADVMEVTLASLKAQASITPFLSAPEATVSYANHTS